MKQNTILISLVLVILVGGLSFGVGYKVGETKNKISGFVRNGTGQMMGNRQYNGTSQGQQTGGMMRGSRQTAGEITAIDDKTMTIKMADGSSKIIILSSSTVVSKSTDAPKTDLKVGQTVAVFGATNTDGSLTAENIELNPQRLGQKN